MIGEILAVMMVGILWFAAVSWLASGAINHLDAMVMRRVGAKVEKENRQDYCCENGHEFTSTGSAKIDFCPRCGAKTEEVSA